MATPLRLVRALGRAALTVRRVWALTYQRGAPGGRPPGVRVWDRAQRRGV